MSYSIIEMKLLIRPLQFDPISIFFLDTKQNMMMIGNFTKMNYSTKHFTMIGLYVAFPIVLADAFLHFCTTNTPMIAPNVDSENNKPANKYVPSFQDNKWSTKKMLYYYPRGNIELLKQISQIEYQILLYYKQSCCLSENLSPAYQFYGKRDSGPIDDLECMNYYRDYTVQSTATATARRDEKYYIKISGIWENKTEYGITYKIVEYHNE